MLNGEAKDMPLKLRKTSMRIKAEAQKKGFLNAGQVLRIG
jgi:hypothetical protein